MVKLQAYTLAMSLDEGMMWVRIPPGVPVYSNLLLWYNILYNAKEMKYANQST